VENFVIFALSLTVFETWAKKGRVLLKIAQAAKIGWRLRALVNLYTGDQNRSNAIVN